MSDQEEITQLLHAWRRGDKDAVNPLFDAAYNNLHAAARQILYADRMRFSLQPTELVNECAIRMFGLSELDWQDRAHFVALATTTMRRILVDEARRRSSKKREGQHLTLMTTHLGAEADNLEVEKISDALDRLAEVSADLARVVELKYFGGLTNPEVAEVMDISESTVKRSWRSARAWLYADLNEE